MDRGPIGGAPDAGFDAPFNDVGMPDAWSPDAFRVDAPIDAFRPIDAYADDSPDAVAMFDTNEPVDAWAPDAFVPPDAYELPDAYVIPDAYVLPDAYVVPDAYVIPDAFTPECTEGATRCVGATGLQLDRCVGGRWTRQTDCSALGCGASASDPNAHCLRLVPSNVPASEMRGGDAVTVTSAGPVAGTIDSTACSGGAGIPATAFRVVGSYCVISVASLRLATGQIELVGSRPVIVLSTGDVTIDSSFSLVGRTTATGGAGESPAGAGGDGAEGGGGNSGGGGGGSFCGSGGVGGAGGTGGAAGTAVAASLLSPLRGGSRGGSGSGQMDLRGAGGRGGGALQISSGGTITLNGAIYATGGGGAGGRRTGLLGRSAASGGGGGSGGAVLLEGAGVVFGPGARIDVRGGAGGSGACFDDTPSGDEDGVAGEEGYVGAGTRPIGGAAPTCELTSVFTAGPGGNASGLDQAGGLNGGAADNGGGAGGGAGCLAVRAPTIPASIPTYPSAASIRATASPVTD